MWLSYHVYPPWVRRGQCCQSASAPPPPHPRQVRVAFLLCVPASGEERVVLTGRGARPVGTFPLARPDQAIGKVPPGAPTGPAP